MNNTSHFLLCPIPPWGKNNHSLICSFDLICPIGHVRPFCALATRLVCEQENIIVTFIVVPHILNKTRIEISRQFFDKSSEKLKALQRIR